MWRFLLPPFCLAEAMGFSARRAVKGNEQGTQAAAIMPPSLGAHILSHGPHDSGEAPGLPCCSHH
jgi:hypothetical protein